MTQPIDLNPGWNAVNLWVRPADQEPSRVFSGIPAESVWQWNRRFNPVQFIQSAEQLRPSDPDWLVYLPSGPASGISTLHAITGGQSYLIKLSGTQRIKWQVTGIPVSRRPNWIPDSLNLVGFRVGDTVQPTFAEFFNGSPAHRGTPVYRLRTNGAWEQEPNSSTATLDSNEAFWIQTRGASTYGGPLEIVLEQFDRMDFGTALVEHRLRIKNVDVVDRTVLIAPLNSAAAPQGSPANAGSVLLARWRAEISNKVYGWEPISAETSVGALRPGEQLLVRLAVRREVLAAPAFPSETVAQYQSVLQIRDSEKRFVHLIPVTASYTAPPRRAALNSIGSSESVAKVGPGLWIGNAVIQKISQPSAASNHDTPRATPSEAHFRLIIHVDSEGQSRLLQQVTLVFKEGKKDNEGHVIEPGESVLVTDDALIDRFGGSVVRDGQLTARRFSTVAFGFNTPLAMSGPFGSFQQPLACVVSMGYDDPLNPFKHRFHPDHNNLSEDYKSVLLEGRESYDIVREISLSFEAKDPFDLNLPEYGTRHIGGTYRETIKGVHRRPIFVEGKFRLHNASSVAVLNAGL